MYYGSYICGRNGDDREERIVVAHLRSRFFEEFSYGKQSLDGLLFPQRAFFFGFNSCLFGFCLLFRRSGLPGWLAVSMVWLAWLARLYRRSCYARSTARLVWLMLLAGDVLGIWFFLTDDHWSPSFFESFWLLFSQYFSIFAPRFRIAFPAVPGDG